jgi:integrase
MRAKIGDKEVAPALAAEPTRFLSSVQVGITSIGILNGAIGGAALTGPLRVTFKGLPPPDPRGGLRLAVERAGLPFGRAVGGAPFHTLRHTAASLPAELGEPEAIRKEVMGHRNIATTQRYTHLRPVHEIPAHERLADAVPIADLVTVARKRSAGKPVVKNVVSRLR